MQMNDAGSLLSPNSIIPTPLQEGVVTETPLPEAQLPTLLTASPGERGAPEMSNLQVNIPSGREDPFYRYKMPKMVVRVQGKGNGSTAILNLDEVA